MDVRNRLIIFVAGLGLAWALMLAGGEMHAWARGAVTSGNLTPLALLVGLGTVLAIIGMILFCVMLAVLSDGDLPSDTTAAMLTSAIAICFFFVFGAVGGALGADAWKSVWDFLLILGLLPVVLSGADLVADILRSQRGAG